jgi:hypothetical protein
VTSPDHPTSTAERSPASSSLIVAFLKLSRLNSSPPHRPRAFVAQPLEGAASRVLAQTRFPNLVRAHAALANKSGCAGSRSGSVKSLSARSSRSSMMSRRPSYLR